MTNPFEVLDYSVSPADVLANTVRQRSIANSEPQWLVHARHEALDAYLSLAPEENQRRVSRQLLLGQTAMDDLHDGPRDSAPSIGAATDSDVANRIRSEELEAEGVVSMDLRRAVIDHSDLVREYLGSLMDATTRWAHALNTAIWSRGHFVYVPESTRVEASFQPYDRTNASRMEPFERTFIVAAPGSSFGFVEGCSAPIFTMDSFRAPLTEVVVLEGASVTYATIGNYTRNVLATVNRRAIKRIDDVDRRRFGTRIFGWSACDRTIRDRRERRDGSPSVRRSGIREEGSWGRRELSRSSDFGSCRHQGDRVGFRED